MYLYPRKSNNLVTTSVNTQIHVDKTFVDPVTGANTIELSCDVYYDPATLNTSIYYNWINGRGNNSGFHSGMMLPGGLNEAQFEGRWRLQGAGSVINKAGLTADWYNYSMIVTATTFQIRLLNLRTLVLLEGNVKNIGNVDNADTFNYTWFCYGISGVSGAYGTIGINICNVKMTRNNVTTVNIPCSEGHLTKIHDIESGLAYQLNFLTVSSGWAKVNDYKHHNFVKGFTLYQKPLNVDLRIPNKNDGSEIAYTPTLSYTRTANFGSSLLSFNGCESLFKLDDVEEDTLFYTADPDHFLFTEGSGVAKEFDMNLINMASISDRGYLYYNETLKNNFMCYATDKTLLNDIKIIKYIGMSSRINYDETGLPNYDENNHVELTED